MRWGFPDEAGFDLAMAQPPGDGTELVRRTDATPAAFRDDSSRRGLGVGKVSALPPLRHEGVPGSSCLPGRRVDLQPEPGSAPGRETLRGRRRGRRGGERRHPCQWSLRGEIRARPCVGHQRLPQIGSALAAEVTAVADLGPELLGCVRVAASPADRHEMVRAQLEEQRPESDKHQHDAYGCPRSTSLSSTDDEIVRWNRVDSGG